MTIDWSKEVETTEDPPRPVRVLATDLPEPWCVAAHVGTGDLVMRFKSDGEPYSGMPCIRNVPPPKPEPVLIEGWVNFVKASTAYEGGTYWVVRNGAVWTTREWAIIEAGKMSDVIGTAYIRVMSDGSPVPMEDPLSTKWFDAAVYEARIAELGAKAEALQAAVERMRHVVEAAVAWRENFCKTTCLELLEAVHIYQSKQAPTEPVKNCTTCLGASVSGCKWYSGVSVENCVVNGYDKWEPRHD